MKSISILKQGYLPLKHKDSLHMPTISVLQRKHGAKQEVSGIAMLHYKPYINRRGDPFSLSTQIAKTCTGGHLPKEMEHSSES